MDLTREEAESSILAIQEVMDQTRRAIARTAGPSYSILWGAIWFVGYMLSYFVEERFLGWIWIPLVLIGSAANAILGVRYGSRVRVPGSSRVYYFWLALFLYGLVWIFLANPAEGKTVSVYIVSVLMFGFVALGLWTSRVLILVGLVVTALALVGYLLLNPYFYLWMAFLGGGTLFSSGIYMQRIWK